MQLKLYSEVLYISIVNSLYVITYNNATEAPKVSLDDTPKAFVLFLACPSLPGAPN